MARGPRGLLPAHDKPAHLMSTHALSSSQCHLEVQGSGLEDQGVQSDVQAGEIRRQYQSEEAARIGLPSSKILYHSAADVGRPRFWRLMVAPFVCPWAVGFMATRAPSLRSWLVHQCACFLMAWPSVRAQTANVSPPEELV